MELHINERMLEDMGLAGATDAQKQEIVTSMMDLLEANVATRLAEQLTDERLNEFDQLSAQWENQSPEESQMRILEWMKQHNVDYEAIVRDEFERLKATTTQSVDDIMADL